MLIIGLDGKAYKLKLKKSEILDENRSSYHLKTRELLKTIYPSDNIFEEIVIPGSKLKLDFILPLRKLVVEVNGLQHYEFNRFFHKNLKDFYEGKNRDCLKKEWCNLNGFIFIALDARDSEERWKQQILAAYN